MIQLLVPNMRLQPPVSTLLYIFPSSSLTLHILFSSPLTIYEFPSSTSTLYIFVSSSSYLLLLLSPSDTVIMIYSLSHFTFFPWSSSHFHSTRFSLYLATLSFSSLRLYAPLYLLSLSLTLQSSSERQQCSGTLSTSINARTPDQPESEHLA